MGTKTISLSEEAYNRLKAAKKEGESFSDVVNRITPGVRLADYWEILDDEAADELRDTIATERARRNEARARRRDRITTDLSSEDPDR